MQMKKVKEVLVAENTDKKEEKKAAVKRRLQHAKTAFALAMVAVNISMLINPVFASQTSATAGADMVKNSISLLFSIVAAFVSSYGGIQVLWGVFEWGNATNTQDGMMQSMSVRRIGGGLVQTIAPQLVTSMLG